MYRMSIMTMFAPASLNLDLAKCMRMALVHDMGEALVGDITPGDRIEKSVKSRMEGDTIDYIAQTLLVNVENGHAGEEIKRLWREYEDNKTREANFVHDIDKMELMLQVLEYEKSHSTADFRDFDGSANQIKLPEVKTWCDEVLKELKELRESKGLDPRLTDGDPGIAEQAEENQR
jgi:putative hydrolase of HD superfamily